MSITKASISTAIFISFLNPLHSQVWKQFTDSAKVYTKNNNTDKAIEFYYKALEELKKDSMGTNSYVQVCDTLGISLYRNREYKEAEKFYLEAKEIQEKLAGKENPDYATLCYDLAGLYRIIGEFERSEDLYLESKQIREKVLGKQDTDYAASCNKLAGSYWMQGQLDKAESLFLESKQIREKVLGKQNPNYAVSCYNLGVVYLSKGQYEKAEMLELEAKKILENSLGKESNDYANCCNNLAEIYRSEGQYEKAEELYQKSISIKEKLLGRESLDYALCCNNLSKLCESMGQYEKAVILDTEAMEIQEKILGRESIAYAESCSNLGRVYLDMKQYEKTEVEFSEAKQILEKNLTTKNIIYAGSCIDLGNLNLKLGRLYKAEALMLEAKQIQEKVLGKQNADYANSCNSLATVYWGLGEFEKAKLLFLEAKEIRKKTLGLQHPLYGYSCNSLATLYWDMHQSLLAEKEFKESFSVNAFNLNAAFQFTTEKEKAAFIKNILGEDDKAYSFYLSEKLRSEQPYSISLFHRNLILSSSQAMNKQLFYSNDSAVINKYNDWLNLKRYLSVLYSRPISERKEDPAKIEDSAGVLEKELMLMSAKFKKQQQNITWKDIKDNLKNDEASIEFATFHLIKYVYTDSIFYIALVLRKDDDLPSMTFLFNEKQLSDLLSSAGDKTTNDGIKELYTSGDVISAKNNNRDNNGSIYDLIWKPLEKELKGIKTIYFSPSGLLHRIAFAAMPVNRKEVLSDKYKLVQLTTTASVADQTPTYIVPSDNFQLYGGIKYDADSTDLKQSAQLYAYNTQKGNSRSIPDDISRGGSFNYLPGTKTEIETIENQAKNTQNHISVLSGINATEESFKALDGKASPSVIHIATHGFFFPDPKVDKQDSIQQMFETSGKVFKQSDNPLFRSGLLFAGANNSWHGKPIDGIEDGILTAYEVSNMYLPNTKLVVLSACETALGDIQGSEGVYGLQRAFKMAGVQNLVMSLWKVPDIETAMFMENFYQNLFAKQSIDDAFYNAQKTMKNKYRDEPYKWAAWVLIR
jgi:CHAT domain-containing protein/Tfp pilus assembly protein PilF